MLNERGHGFIEVPRAGGRVMSKLEFEAGKLVKVDGQRPEYMDEYAMIGLIKDLAAWGASK